MGQHKAAQVGAVHIVGYITAEETLAWGTPIFSNGLHVNLWRKRDYLYDTEE